MLAAPNSLEQLDPQAFRFYVNSLTVLRQARVPFLVGGAYALAHYTGIIRQTKDFDIFLRREDAQRVLDLLTAEGYRAEITFPHWLGKAFQGDSFVDLIFSSGNGLCAVDDTWFDHATTGKVLGQEVHFTAPEEMIWQKAFIMERERFDGADVVHLLRACGQTMDWDHLLTRFGNNWRVLFSHLILFGFVYPGETTRIPDRVMLTLLERLQPELTSSSSGALLCRGTLLSRSQYLSDTERWDYQDARLPPSGTMTPEEITHWTAAAEK